MTIDLIRIGRAAVLVILLLSGLIWATGRLAMAQSWDDVSQVITVTPVAGWRDAPTQHVAGLRISLEPGWKTYWRSAGSAGIAPRMQWTGSENVKAVAPAWPAPGLFRQAGELSIGYDADFVLPLRVETGSGAARLRGRLDLGVCSDVCLPVQIEIEIDLPSDTAPDASLVMALADSPRRMDRYADCTTRPTSDGLALVGALDLPPLGGAEAVVFEVPDPLLWITDAIVTREGDRITGESELMMATGTEVGLDPAQVRITVIGAQGAIELAGCAK